MGLDRRILSILYYNDIVDVNDVEKFIGEKNGYYLVVVNGEIKKLKVPGFVYPEDSVEEIFNDFDLEDEFEESENFSDFILVEEPVVEEPVVEEPVVEEPVVEEPVVEEPVVEELVVEELVVEELVAEELVVEEPVVEEPIVEEPIVEEPVVKKEKVKKEVKAKSKSTKKVDDDFDDFIKSV